MADQIVVLEGGVISEAGSHEALLANEGMYARMFRLQARGYSEEGYEAAGDEVGDESVGSTVARWNRCPPLPCAARQILGH